MSDRDELAERLASMPAAEAIRGPRDWATIQSALRGAAQTSWHSMDTAPKDGTEILGWWHRSKTHAIIAWSNDGWWKDSADDNMVSAPTHWQYLQDGPSVSSADLSAQPPLTVGVLHDIFITMRHARTFITSREKMHPTGVELWDRLFAQIEALQPVLPQNGTAARKPTQ